VAVRTLHGHRTAVDTVLFAPDGKRLASLARDWSFKFWDASSARELGTQRHFIGCYRAALSPDGKHLAVTHRNPEGARATQYELRVQDAHRPEDVFRLPAHAWPVRALAYSADGHRLATGADDKLVKIWDVPSRSLLVTLGGHTAPVRDLAFSPDGNVLASCGEDGGVRLWDAGEGRLLRTVGLGTRVTTVAFSPNGQRLAAAGADGVVTLWDPANGKAIRSLKHPAAVACVRFSPDGGRLAAATAAGVIHLWDPADGRPLLTLRDHRAAVQTLAFSPDGQRLASGSADRTVKLWDLVPWPPPPTGPREEGRNE
jgi:WD40 repeat protein